MNEKQIDAVLTVLYLMNEALGRIASAVEGINARQQKSEEQWAADLLAMQAAAEEIQAVEDAQPGLPF
jgi:hypothetical protein